MRAVVQAWLPWIAAALVAAAACRLLMWLGGGRWRPAKLRSLHADESGAVQSLAFVLTLPVFLLFAMFIVQVAQVMLGIMVVHYAAFAAARAAQVWVPGASELAEDPGAEGANRMEPLWPRLAAVADEEDEHGREEERYFLTWLDLEPYARDPQAKAYRVWMAAVVGCLPVAPSGDKLPLDGRYERTAAALEELHRATLADGGGDRTGDRLRRKLGFATAVTRMGLEIVHPATDQDLHPEAPPGTRVEIDRYGWRDTFVVTLEHDMVLLPGPMRMVAAAAGNVGPDDLDPELPAGSVRERLSEGHGEYLYTLRAEAAASLEGRRCVVPFVP